MIDMYEGIFIKTVFRFKESHKNMSHKLKSKRCNISKVNDPFVHLLMSLTTWAFFIDGINVRSNGEPKKSLMV